SFTGLICSEGLSMLVEENFLSVSILKKCRKIALSSHDKKKISKRIGVEIHAHKLREVQLKSDQSHLEDGCLASEKKADLTCGEPTENGGGERTHAPHAPASCRRIRRRV